MFRFCHVSGEISFYYLLTEVLKLGNVCWLWSEDGTLEEWSETCNTVGFEVGGRAMLQGIVGGL